MTIKDIPSDTIVKIGTTDGAGFLYAGKAGECDFVTLNHKLYDDEWNIFAREAMKFKMSLPSVSKKKLVALLKYADLVQNYEPLPDREIVEKFDSAIEDAVVVTVKGASWGQVWLYDETERPVKVKNTNAAVMNVAAIYREIVEELELAYIESVSGDTPIKRKNAVIDAQKHEAELRTDEYGMISDAKYVINRTRQNAITRLCAKTGKPCEQVEKMLAEVMG